MPGSIDEGCALTCMVCREEDAAETHGHITSLAVARTHRKLGLATRLMESARARSSHRPCLHAWDSLLGALELRW
jgi:peptide alpha-N-acetyltransferase